MVTLSWVKIRCTACRREFDEQLISGVASSVLTAYIESLNCRHCSAGHESLSLVLQPGVAVKVQLGRIDPYMRPEFWSRAAWFLPLSFALLYFAWRGRPRL